MESISSTRIICERDGFRQSSALNLPARLDLQYAFFVKEEYIWVFTKN